MSTSPSRNQELTLRTGDSLVSSGISHTIINKEPREAISDRDLDCSAASICPTSSSRGVCSLQNSYSPWQEVFPGRKESSGIIHALVPSQPALFVDPPKAATVWEVNGSKEIGSAASPASVLSDISDKLPDKLEDRLIEVYFETVNPQWPFLDYAVFRDWYEFWKKRRQGQFCWQGYFVNMVNYRNLFLKVSQKIPNPISVGHVNWIDRRFRSAPGVSLSV